MECNATIKIQHTFCLERDQFEFFVERSVAESHDPPFPREALVEGWEFEVIGRRSKGDTDARVRGTLAGCEYDVANGGFVVVPYQGATFDPDTVRSFDGETFRNQYVPLDTNLLADAFGIQPHYRAPSADREQHERQWAGHVLRMIAPPNDMSTLLAHREVMPTRFLHSRRAIDHHIGEPALLNHLSSWWDAYDSLADEDDVHAPHLVKTLLASTRFRSYGDTIVPPDRVWWYDEPFLDVESGHTIREAASMATLDNVTSVPWEIDPTWDSRMTHPGSNTLP